MMKTESVRAKFKSIAVIDWLELTLTLTNSTQFRYVRAQLGAILGTTEPPYVYALDPAPGGASTKFAFRLQDTYAASLTDLDRFMTALALVFPFAAPPTVSSIEISLDFFPKSVATDVTALVHRLQLSIQAYGNPRQYDPAKSPLRNHCNRHLNPDRPEPVTGLKIDPNLNLRIGNRNDAVQWQIYDKRTDNNGKPISTTKRRARAEFTLTGKEFAKQVLGADGDSRLVTLSDLKAFKFERLASFLHFRRFKSIEKITPDPVMSKMLEHTLSWREHGIINYNIGMNAFYQDERRPDAGRRAIARAHSSHTYADIELNDVVRRSFRTLTTRFA